MRAEIRSLAAIGSATVLGVAVYLNSRALGIALLVPALVLASVAALGDDRWAPKQDRGRLAPAVHRVSFVVGVLIFAGALNRALDMTSATQLALFAFAIAGVGAAAFGVVVLRKDKRFFALFIGAFVIVTIGMLTFTRGHGHVDVGTFQEQSAQALAEGTNPYSIRFPDEYGDRSDDFYGPGVSVDGVLQFGYPYLPLSLLVVAPFELLFHDYRLAHALAAIAAALVMSLINPGRDSRSVAALFLMVSPSLYILRFGWTEPLLILAGSLVVLAATRHRHAATPYLMGVFLALKQYSVLLVPASLLLLERPWRIRDAATHVGKAALVVAVTVLPFFLWNPGEFFWSVVELQFVQPFREDSLSFLALWAIINGEPSLIINSLVPLSLVGLVTFATWKRTPTGGQGFSLAAALTLLTAFAFSKQAFANYYFLVIGLLFIGAAAGHTADHEPAIEGGEMKGQLTTDMEAG